MLKFQAEVEEISKAAKARSLSRHLAAGSPQSANDTKGSKSTSAADVATSSAARPSSGASLATGHQKKPSADKGKAPTGTRQSPTASTAEALPRAEPSVSSGSTSGAQPSSFASASLQATLLAAVDPTATEESHAALVTLIEDSLRASPSSELLVRLGRRPRLTSWYQGEKRGPLPGTDAAERDAEGWDGESLPDTVGLDALEETLKAVVGELEGELLPLLRTPPPDATYTALLRLAPPSLEHLPELRIAAVGNVDAGKSTTLGVLTRGGLDDGRGKARVGLFRHKHELESGRTSSVGMEILGFTAKGDPVLPVGGVGEGESYGRREKLGWEDICKRSAKVISFIDLAGHERYLSTTIFGMSGCAPDYCLLLIGGNAGLIGMSKEHLAVALALNVPVIVLITKIDMTPAHVLEQTKTQLAKILKSPGCRRTPVFVQDERDVVELSQSFVGDRLCPIFLMSNVTGESLPLLRSFLNLLPTSAQGGGAGVATKFDASAPLEYSISDCFSVPFVGTVVNGVLNAGTVKTGDNVLLGPDSLGQFVSTTVKSIQRKRASVTSAEAGQSVSFALKRVRRTAVRKGMVILAKNETGEVPRAVKRFEGQVLVLYHNTTISPGYQAVMHTGPVKQTCRIISMDHPKGILRTGDRCTILFEFVSAPEYIKEGAKILFREGKTKGLGVVTRIVS